MSEVERVVSHVQHHWSQHGIEVRSRGPRSVTLALPPDLDDLSTLCLELFHEFDATVNMQHSADDRSAHLVVWLHSTASKPRTASKEPTESISVWVISAAIFVFAFVSACVICEPPLVLHEMFRRQNQT